MNKEEIFEKIARELDYGGLSYKVHSEIALTDTAESLGLDSVDLLELVIGLEEVFRIKINDYEANDCTTLSDLTDLVERELLENRKPR